MHVLDAASSTHFAASRDRLDAAVREFGGEVSDTLARVVAAFTERDAAAARLAIEAGAAIAARGRRLDEECLKVLALYRPMGRDLRQLTATEKLVRDLVRMGELAARLGEQVADPAERDLERAPRGLVEAGDLVRSMIEGAVDSLLRRDVLAADRVLAAEERRAERTRTAAAEVEARMESHPGDLHADLGALAVLDGLERIAKRAVNVAEDVVYLIEETVLRRVC